MNEPMLWIDNVQPTSSGGSVKISEAAALSEEEISLTDPKSIYTASFSYSNFPVGQVESIREKKICFGKVTGKIVTKDADTNSISNSLDVTQTLELTVIP